MSIIQYFKLRFNLNWIIGCRAQELRKQLETATNEQKIELEFRIMELETRDSIFDDIDQLRDARLGFGEYFFFPLQSGNWKIGKKKKN
jgi:hypothetical protein